MVKQAFQNGGASLSALRASSQNFNPALAAEVAVTIPYRGVSRDATYFVTASAFEKKAVLQSDRMAGLFVDVLLHYRKLGKYHLHEFVVMPDHFHLLLTPISPVTLEKAVQFIKGALSYRAKRELGYLGKSGRRVFMIGEFGMRMSILAFGITFVRTLCAGDWRPCQRSFCIARLECGWMYLSG